MSSREHTPSPERRLPQWEMDLSWEDLVVAVLERKVIPAGPLAHLTEDDTHYDDCLRMFRTSNGDQLVAWVIHDRRKDGEIENSVWSLAITPGEAASGNGVSPPSPYRFHIERRSDHPNTPYEVNQVGSDIPLPSEAVEALLTTIVTMTPTSETESLPTRSRLSEIGWP